MCVCVGGAQNALRAEKKEEEKARRRRERAYPIEDHLLRGEPPLETPLGPLPTPSEDPHIPPRLLGDLLAVWDFVMVFSRENLFAPTHGAAGEAMLTTDAEVEAADQAAAAAGEEEVSAIAHAAAVAAWRDVAHEDACPLSHADAYGGGHHAGPLPEHTNSLTLPGSVRGASLDDFKAAVLSRNWRGGRFIGAIAVPLLRLLLGDRERKRRDVAVREEKRKRRGAAAAAAAAAAAEDDDEDNIDVALGADTSGGGMPAMGLLTPLAWPAALAAVAGSGDAEADALLSASAAHSTRLRPAVAALASEEFWTMPLEDKLAVLKFLIDMVSGTVRARAAERRAGMHACMCARRRRSRRS